MQGRGRAAPIMGGDAHQHVVDLRLGVYDHDIEITVVVEHSSVEQLELRLVLAALPVLLHKLRVGELRLRVLVEVLHVGVRRR